jgi:hypothetical protein
MIEVFPRFPLSSPAVVVICAQVEEQQKKAMEEDPSVFSYDEVYDEMKEKAARPKVQDKVVREVTPPSYARDAYLQFECFVYDHWNAWKRRK